ncbi:MAG: hypothetical protein IJI34_01530 [Clostridia bacterium]|nr:hypothetical protein [Clostridia bacterium]
MGQFFDRILVRETGEIPSCELVKKVLQELGYSSSEEGEGVFVTIKRPSNEWLELESPLSRTEGQFELALSRICKTPVLHITCFDSDFAVCELTDESNQIKTTACINKPFYGLHFGESDYAAWSTSFKTKWNCTPEQFKMIFEAKYRLAEDGIARLADLLHITSVKETEKTTLWFKETDAAIVHPVYLPRPVEETLPEYMEHKYAVKMDALGFRRYRNSLVRWHKVVGEPGNEVVLSIVFAIRHKREIAPFYGAQSLYCPLVLSDKYYPLHDADAYWTEASFEYVRRFGRNPLRRMENGREVGYSLDCPEYLSPFIDDLILPDLIRISDFESCWSAYAEREQNRFSWFNSYRRWIEAALRGDDAAARSWYRKWKSTTEEWEKTDFSKLFWNKEIELNMLKVFETGGCDALVAYLRDTVYRDNMKKLKRAGIV